MKAGYLIVVGTLLAGSALAQDKGPLPANSVAGEKHSDRGMMIEQLLGNPRVAKELGLTDEQTALLKAKTFEMTKQQLELRHQAEMLALDQAQLMSEAVPDEAKILALVDKAGLVRTEESKLRISHMLLIKRTLTPEQHEAVKKMMHRRAEQMRKQAGGGEKKNRQAWKNRGEGEGQKLQPPPDRDADEKPVPPPDRDDDGADTDQPVPPPAE